MQRYKELLKYANYLMYFFYILTLIIYVGTKLTFCSRKSQRIHPGGLAAQEGPVAVLVQDGHGDVCGEDVLQGGLDVLHEEGLDVAPLEVVGAVEVEGGVPEVT